jgi:hypothetical protein
MSSVNNVLPQNQAQTRSTRESVKDFVNSYFDLSSSSACETALKVASYMTLIFPAIVLVLKLYLYCTEPGSVAETHSVTADTHKKSSFSQEESLDSPLSSSSRASSDAQNESSSIQAGSLRPERAPFSPNRAASNVRRPVRSAQKNALSRPERHPVPRNVLQAQLLPPAIQAVLDNAPRFAKYRIGRGTPYPNTNLTAVTVRPVNLFFDALLGPGSTTLPGGPLFAFRHRHTDIRNHILRTDPNQVVEFTARGKRGEIRKRGAQPVPVADLGELYGTATCRFSYGEFQSTWQSQKIYTCPLLPLPFYRALKHAMQQDKIVTLPGTDAQPKKVKELATANCRALIANVRAQFGNYGFASQADCDKLLDLTLYQLGALVVKTEDFRIMIDANGRIRERNPGERDAIRLINACGIRGVRATPSPMNQPIVQQTFETALRSAESGFVVVPAVGMGVWGGDPNLYWTAFLNAVITSGNNLEQIFVNPGHQITQGGPYDQCNGNEFQSILDQYRVDAERAGEHQAMKNLAKITNLYERQTDVLHLSHQLKVAFPDKIVSLFNASDPDVTLGNHVGEYVNNLDHATTTEENYAAVATSLLCFETITGVHEDDARLIQM